jgi:hypothetical protein
MSGFEHPRSTNGLLTWSEMIKFFRNQLWVTQSRVSGCKGVSPSVTWTASKLLSTQKKGPLQRDRHFSVAPLNYFSWSVVQIYSSKIQSCAMIDQGTTKGTAGSGHIHVWKLVRHPLFRTSQIYSPPSLAVGFANETQAHQTVSTINLRSEKRLGVFSERNRLRMHKK